MYVKANHLGNVLAVVSDRKIAVANNTACKTCQDVKTVYDVYLQSNGAVNPLSMGGFVSYANAQLALNSTVSDYTRALKDCGLWMSTLNFNGSSTTLESQTAAGFNPGTGDLTLEAWVNFSSLSGYRMIIDNTQDVGGVVRGFQLFAYNNHLYFGVFEGNNGNAQVQTSAALAGTGQWMHVAAVKTGYNPASYTIYINGNAVSTTANPSSGPTGSSGMNNTASLRLGVNKYSSTAQDYFSGAIKGVRIYGRSLSGAEIAGNYSSGCIKPITNRSNLLYEASINEGSGLTVSDQSGGHLASSITNGSWSTAIAPGTGCLTAAELAQQLCYFVSTTPNVSVAYFTGEVLSANDYYAFGATMPGRSFTSSSYRYGFNGKENDPETNTQDYGLRIYNPSLGKFLSVDPLFKEYPWYTPYQFAGNRPIDCIDLDGGEPYKDDYQFTSTNPKMALYNSSNVVDMSKLRTGTSYNSLGWPRDSKYFWGEYQFTPLGRQALSPSNLEIIKKGGTPVVDEHWNSVMKQYGNDGVLGEIIQHHHSDKGPMTYAVPQSKHTGKGYTVENHSMEPRVGRVNSTPGKYLKLSKGLNTVTNLGDIASIFLNSPNSPIYFFHVPGTGNQNRAYPTNSEDGTMAPYYEWRLMDDKKTRETKYYDSYERRDGEWRGKDQVGETEYFDLDGNKTSKPSTEKVKG